MQARGVDQSRCPVCYSPLGEGEKVEKTNSRENMKESSWHKHEQGN